MSFEWGISPLDLEHIELKDIAYYVLSRYNTKMQEAKAQAEKEKRMMYSQARMNASFIGALFSKNAQIPSYEQVFGENENVITKDNAFEYLLEKHNSKLKGGV